MEKSMLCQWLKVNKIAVLCGFYRKANTQSLARSLGASGALGEAPCLQEITHETCSRGSIETKTHPSFIMIFGYCHKMQWPEQAALVTKDFLGTDVCRELVTLRSSISATAVPVWDANWIGSEEVPHLGNIHQKWPNMSMWCRYSFQNCVWLGKAIPSKLKQEKHAALLAQQQAAKRVELQENTDRSRGNSTKPQDYFTEPHPWGH